MAFSARLQMKRLIAFAMCWGLVSASPFIPRGGASSAASLPIQQPDKILRVAYQGEPGAYSDKSTRELLGQNVIAIGKPSFEACFQAVASMEVDYACLPIENSLGGSIHDNYDLLLRYDLRIVAEHEFRVKHCLMAKPGVQRSDIKYAISHPQALAQCDNFLRGLGITPIGTYDTAGSAKMIRDGSLPDKCTVENTAAIASDLAAKTYGLKCLDIGIEDDDTNFTRFLLLARKGVVEHISKSIPAKTSVVFTLPDTPGALYKALACFSLRDIDFSKIESRPTSASLLNFLKFRSQQKSHHNAKNPRFRYCFYLDFLGNPHEESTQNALSHLREQADYLRVLGSYPQKSRLVGPVKTAVEGIKHLPVADPSLLRPQQQLDVSVKPLNIGILGFGDFGQFLAERLVQKHHHTRVMDETDYSKQAQKLGVDYYPTFDFANFLSDLDILVLCVPLIQLQETIQNLPISLLKGKLVVEMGVLNAHPKSLMLAAFGDHADIDLVASHPMFVDGGMATSSPIVYEKVRVGNAQRCEAFFQVFDNLRLVEMDSAEHDESIADAEFVTHLTGTLLSNFLPASPVSSKEYAALCELTDTVCDFETFYGMFKYTKNAKSHLARLRDNLAELERRIIAKDSYLAATQELQTLDRQRLYAEAKSLLQEAAREEVAKVQRQPSPKKKNDKSQREGGATK